MHVTAAPAVLPRTRAPPATDGWTRWETAETRDAGVLPMGTAWKMMHRWFCMPRTGHVHAQRPPINQAPGENETPPLPPSISRAQETRGGGQRGAINHGVIFSPCTPLL